MAVESRFHALCRLLTRDPSGRGVAGLRPWGAKTAGEVLEASARRLLASDGPIGIVTGFYIPGADPPAAETDGPLGALALARALEARGRAVHWITDPFAAPLLEAGRDSGALRAEAHVIPWTLADYTADLRCALDWMTNYLNGPGAKLSALVSIERVGPAHSPASALRWDDDPVEAARDFASVPAEDHDRRHNMRGEIIDRFTPPLDWLFDEVKKSRPECFTLGIGDGGNEIGLGCFSWRQLAPAIHRSPGERIACRIATDEVITAGISNWGAYALVAALAHVDPSVRLAETLSVAGERELLTRLVHEAGAVDGVTLERTLSVDGVGVDDYLATLAEMLAI
jgi:hypothetical protein